MTTTYTPAKLHEIIAANDTKDQTISYDEIARYRRSLKTYYEAYNGRPLVIMITAIFNAGALGKIVPASELDTAIEDFLDATDTAPEDREAEKELILFNSLPFDKL